MRFPREIAIGKKRLNRSLVDLAWTESDIRRAARHPEGAFLSVYSFSRVGGRGTTGRVVDYSSAVFDTLFFDLDGPGALEDARTLCLWLMARGIAPRTYFSGRRGFHVYADFPPWPGPVGDMPRRVVSVLPPLSTLDESSFDGPAKMARIPGSLHPDSGLFCIPVDPLAAGSIEEVYALATAPRPDPWNREKLEAQNAFGAWRLLSSIPPPRSGDGETRNPFPVNGTLLSSPPLLRVLRGLPEGRRHYGAVALAVACRLDGLTEGQAERVVATYMSRCSPPLPPALARGEARQGWTARSPWGLLTWALERALL